MYTELLLPTVCISPILFLVGVILIITKIAKKGKLSRLWVLLPVGSWIGSIFILFLTVVYDPSGLIRTAAIISLLIASVISLAVPFLQDRKSIQKFGHNMVSLYFICSLLTVASSGIAILGSSAIINKCEAYHLQVGNTIVASLETYFRDKNNYPSNLAELDPKLIKLDSIFTCYNIRHKLGYISAPKFGEFYYKKCSPKTVQLSIPEMGTGHFHVYDLTEKEWYISNGDPLEERYRVTHCP
jgi:hypothetical protein